MSDSFPSLDGRGEGRVSAFITTYSGFTPTFFLPHLKGEGTG